MVVAMGDTAAEQACALQMPATMMAHNANNAITVAAEINSFAASTKVFVFNSMNSPFLVQIRLNLNQQPSAAATAADQKRSSGEMAIVKRTRCWASFQSASTTKSSRLA
jgi:hypothetical protein